MAIGRAGRPCLWVVDDLPAGLDGQQARSWFAPHPLARTLVTTRSQEYGALGRVVDLDVLDPSEAYELLTVRRPPKGEAEQAAARGIVETLGCHALAVDVAGGVLRAHVSYPEFLAGLGSPEEDELEVVAELAGALPNGHESSIARTLMRSVAQLKDEGRDFLRLAAMLAPAPIPTGLIAAVMEQADGLRGKEATSRARRGAGQAESLSLARPAAEEEVGAWLVHALVTRTARFREQATAPARLEVLRTAALTVLAAELEKIIDPRAHVALRGLVPHARELAREARDPPTVKLLGWVARYDSERGEFRSAASLRRQESTVCQRLYGPKHLNTLLAKNNLAVTLHAQGDLNGARDIQEQLLKTGHRFLGVKRFLIPVVANDLASTLLAQGNLKGAMGEERRT